MVDRDLSYGGKAMIWFTLSCANILLMEKLLTSGKTKMGPQAGLETTDVGFFPPDKLPDLSRGRVVESDIHAAFAFSKGDQQFATFD